MIISENKLRSIIRSIILEDTRSNSGLGKSLKLNYGDTVILKMNTAANVFISSSNPDFDMHSYAGLDYEVHSVHILKGDESKNPFIFCDLLDISSGEIIKDVPCYSNVLSVVKRMKQCKDLKEGDKFILKEITKLDYSTYSGKGDLQSMIGSVFKIIRIINKKDFHGKLYTDTRYAIISTEELELDDLDNFKILFIIPLIDKFVEKLK